MLTCKTIFASNLPASESVWETSSSFSSSETTVSGTGHTEVYTSTRGESESGTSAHAALFKSQFSTTYSKFLGAGSHPDGIMTSLTHERYTYSTDLYVGSSFSLTSYRETRLTVTGTTTFGIGDSTTTAGASTITAGSSTTSGTLLRTISYQQTSTSTYTATISVTTTSTDVEVSYWTTATNTSTSKTVEVSYSLDPAAVKTWFSTVTRTRHYVSGTASVAQPTFGSPPANYAATTTVVAVFADEDEMLFDLTVTGAAATGDASAALANSVSSLVVTNQQESWSTSVGGISIKTVTNTTRSSAGSVTLTYLNTAAVSQITETFSFVFGLPASTRTARLSVTLSSTRTSKDWVTLTETLTYIDGFQGTDLRRSTVAADLESLLALYNETSSLDARSAQWARFSVGSSEATTTASAIGSSSQFKSTSDIATASGKFTRTREPVSVSNVDLRSPKTSHDSRTRATLFPVAGMVDRFGGTFGHVAHPNSSASTDSVYEQLTGDTRNFSAPAAFYSSIRRGIAMPVLGEPQSTESTTVSFDSAGNRVFETVDPGSVVDDYSLLGSNSKDIMAARTIASSSQSWAFHPISRVGGPGFPDWPAAVSIEDALAYTLRDNTGGETSSLFSRWSQDSTLSVPAGQELLMAPLAYWSRNNGGAGYHSARIEN